MAEAGGHGPLAPLSHNFASTFFPALQEFFFSIHYPTQLDSFFSLLIALSHTKDALFASFFSHSFLSSLIRRKSKGFDDFDAFILSSLLSAVQKTKSAYIVSQTRLERQMAAVVSFLRLNDLQAIEQARAKTASILAALVKESSRALTNGSSLLPFLFELSLLTKDAEWDNAVLIAKVRFLTEVLFSGGETPLAAVLLSMLNRLLFCRIPAIPVFPPLSSDN